jgi:hypothetical protein
MMTQSLRDYELNRSKFKYKESSREEVLSLEFLPGDTIYDSVTKKKGEVLAGTRKTIVKFPAS